MRCLLLFLSLAAGVACSSAPRDELAVTREAGDWRPLVIAEVAGLMPGPPPAPGSAAWRADLAGLAAWRREKTPAEAQAIARWAGVDPAVAWAEEAHALAGGYDVPEPARAAHALAHVQAAYDDALVVVWAAKRRHARPGPAHPPGSLTPLAGLPSYPSEDAAVASAAAGVLGACFPEAAAGLAARARAVAEVPVATGRAFPSDVAAGLAIGEQVARAAVARLARDRGAAPAALAWPEAWPLSPEAGAWQPWLVPPVREHWPGVPDPPAPAELAAARARNRGMTIKQRAIAIKWLETDQARTWHARAAALALAGRLTAPQSARVLAFTDLALADSAIAAWKAQYAGARPRPVQLLPGLEPVLPTPAHPAHPADVAAMATSAARYLAQAFPYEAERLAQEAAEAADAGLYAGWYLDSDREAGVELGEAIAARVLARAREDGSP